MRTIGRSNRMKRERRSANPTRERLETYISENPGMSFSLILSVFRMNAGTLRYHLEYLEGAHKIKMVKKDNTRCYFPDYLATFLSSGSNGKELTSMEKRITSIIDGSPGITRKELLTSVDIRREDLSQVIRKLREKNIICVSGEGKHCGYETLTKDKLTGQILSVLIDKLLDNEIDMDTFRRIKDKLES
jgi:predicted transcriptional regulator